MEGVGGLTIRSVERDETHESGRDSSCYEFNDHRDLTHDPNISHHSVTHRTTFKNDPSLTLRSEISSFISKTFLNNPPASSLNPS